MKCLCLGPSRAGKTHIMSKIQDPDAIDFTSYGVPTIGTNVFTIKLPIAPKLPTKKGPHVKQEKSISVLEVGGSMAPMWRTYLNDVEKIIYVVDTSNLCQIAAAGVLLYSLLADPRLQKTKFLLVLTKMDYAYRQMRNEALLMLQMDKLKKQINQTITIVEASAIDGQGVDEILKWLAK